MQINLKFENLNKKYIVTIISTLVAGLFSHGMALFNKYSVYDDNNLFFNYGATTTSGRWMLDLLTRIDSLIYGTSQYSMPLFNGVITIVIISICACIIINLLDIKNNILCAFIGIIMVIFPTITSLFGFMFTSKVYMYGLLLGIFGVYLLCKHHNIIEYVVSIVLIGSSIGIYQGFIPSYLCIIVLFLIKTTIDEKNNFVFLIKKIMYFLVSIILFMFFYFVMNKIVLYFSGLKLTPYQGIDKMGSGTIGDFINRIVMAYKDFIYPAFTLCRAYPDRIKYLYFVYLFMGIYIFVFLMSKIWKEDKKKAVLLVSLFGVLPLASNFIFVMVDPYQADITILMEYGRVYLYIFFVFLLDYLLDTINASFIKIGMALLLITCVMYSRFNNECYLRANIVQQQTISYFTTLITRIKSVEGYKDEYPISFVYTEKEMIKDESIMQLEEFNNITMDPYYDINGYLNKYAWLKFINLWCGYNPTVVEATDYISKEQILTLECYPDSDSIKVIDGIIYIRFN